MGYKRMTAIFAAGQAVAENATKQSIFQQGFGMIKNLAKGGLLLAQSMARAAAELMGVSAMTLGIGTAVAVAAGIAAYAALKSMAPSPAGDMYSPADGKTQVSTKEGGLFELSKNDSLMAFPESKIKNNSSKSSSNVVSTQQDLSPLLEEMRALRQEQSRSNTKPIIVDSYTDSTKTGTATAMRRVKIQ